MTSAVMDRIETGKIMLTNSPIILPLSATTTAYTSGTITNGYGRCSGVYVTVQEGTSAEITVNFTVKTITDTTFEKTKEKIKNHISSDFYEYLQQNYRESNNKAGWFSALFGGQSSNDYEYYTNKTGKFDCNNDTDFEKIAEITHSLETQDVNFSGKLIAKGLKPYPVTVSTYIKITTITFEDGNSLSVVDTNNPVLADKQGNIGGAIVDNGIIKPKV